MNHTIRTTVHIICLVCLVLTALIGSGGTAGAQVVRSNFDSGTEGWRVYEYDPNNPGWRTTGGWAASGGNPGGHIWVTDYHSGTKFWVAPAKFLGDKSAAYNTPLTFDLKQNTNQQGNFWMGDVILRGYFQGKPLALAFNTSQYPLYNKWTHYIVPLNAGAGWKKQDLFGSTPTREEFQAVLSSLTSLEIRAEYAKGTETNRLDNVALRALPPSGLSPMVFATNRNGNGDIYLMNANGTNVTRLTNHPAEDQWPSFFQDRSKIAFMSNRDGNWEIYVMNADGTGQRRLTNNPAADYTPCVSPDGTQIAFASNRDGNWEIYVMNSDGTGLRRLTNNPAPDLDITWSPDSKKICFSSIRDRNWELYEINVDGTGLKNLTNTSSHETNPAWSPDGTQISFMSDRTGNWEVYSMNADGTEVKQLTDNPALDGPPVWSPDGTLLAFLSNRNGNWEIYVMSADGKGEAINVTQHPANEGFFSWVP